MPFAVEYLATYLTRRGKKREEDFEALYFVKAFKGDPISHSKYIPVAGTRRLLEDKNKDDVFAWFGEMAAPKVVAKLGFAGKLFTYGIVPIPSSAAVVGQPAPTRHTSVLMAQALAAQLAQLGYKCVVADVLRWKRQLPSSRTSNIRDAEIFYGNLELVGTAPNRAIVVDDVLTSGSHMRAAVALLSKAGSTVQHIICAGRTVQIDPKDPWAGGFEIYNEFSPPDRFS